MTPLEKRVEELERFVQVLQADREDLLLDPWYLASRIDVPPLAPRTEEA